MTQDPIIQEVRAIRDQIASEYDYDIDAIFEALRTAETSSGKEHVTLATRKTDQSVAADPSQHR
jgi:hypothetical protein